MVAIKIHWFSRWNNFCKRKKRLMSHRFTCKHQPMTKRIRNRSHRLMALVRGKITHVLKDERCFCTPLQRVSVTTAAAFQDKQVWDEFPVETRTQMGAYTGAFGAIWKTKQWLSRNRRLAHARIDNAAKLMALARSITWPNCAPFDTQALPNNVCAFMGICLSQFVEKDIFKHNANYFSNHSSL